MGRAQKLFSQTIEKLKSEGINDRMKAIVSVDRSKFTDSVAEAGGAPVRTMRAVLGDLVEKVQDQEKNYVLLEEIKKNKHLNKVKMISFSKWNPLNKIRNPRTKIKIDELRGEYRSRKADLNEAVLLAIKDADAFISTCPSLYKVINEEVSKVEARAIKLLIEKFSLFIKKLRSIH